MHKSNVGYNIQDNVGYNLEDNLWTIFETISGTKNSKSESKSKLSSGTLRLVFIQKTASVEIVPKFIPKIDLEIVPKMTFLPWPG